MIHAFSSAPNLSIVIYFPLWLFALRQLAYIADVTLIVFALYLIGFAWQSVIVLLFALLMILFALTNFRAIAQSSRVLSNQPFRFKDIAYLLNLILPVAYFLGTFLTGAFSDLELKRVLAILVPSVLNWLAIEETLKFQARDSSST